MDGVKVQFRSTAQKLGQLRDKSLSRANITRNDIATLIQQGSLSIAREKAEKLIFEEAFQDVLRDIEFYLGILSEGYHQLEQNRPPSPALIEAASTVIHAAPYIHSKDLDTCRKELIHKLGPDFARSAVGNHDQYVSQKLLRNLSTPIPSASQLDDYLKGIADDYGIPWTPPPTSENNITALSELLDFNSQGEVDLLRLKELCGQGIPDYPEWLRPRIWKLLLGIVTPTKKSWKSEMMQQRNAYYDLVRRILDPYCQLNSESLPVDHDLLAIHRQLSGLPGSVYALLDSEPERPRFCPLDQDAPADLKIPSASWLDTRLSFLQNKRNEASSVTPDIRIESEFNSTPGISLTSFESTLSTDAISPTTLLPSRKYIFGNAHPRHCSSLLRLLFVNKSVNPESSLFQSASILVPLYSVLTLEVEHEDLTHLEADTFWLFEAVMAEFSGLEDDLDKWMSMLSERVRWADIDLYNVLESLGLEPSLPHYSYRWLVPLLTHTLPLRALFMVWDSLFSFPTRSKDSHPRLNHLVNVCASMLIRGKVHIIRFNNVGRNRQSLWSFDDNNLSPSTKVLGRSGDPFVDTLSFLQIYNPQNIGGIERVLQTASELAKRRELEFSYSRWPNLGPQLKSDVWEALTLQRQSQKMVGEGRRKETPVTRDGLTLPGGSRQSPLHAQVTDFVWRGITNRIAMEDDSASPPPSPKGSATRSRNGKVSPSVSQGTSTIWNYAEKLKDSDALATLSKVGSNWRARGLLPSWNLTSWSGLDPSSEFIQDEDLPDKLRSSSATREHPSTDSVVLSSPSIQSPASTDSLRGSIALSPPASNKLMEKTKMLVSKTRSGLPNSGSKSAPKPLLLNSSTSVMSGYGHPRSASGSFSTPDNDEWADVMQAKRHNFHRDSLSSVSSLSPSDAFGRTSKSARSDKETGMTSSRVVALNRRSVSPMAPAFRVNRSNPSSRNSSISSGHNSPSKSPLQQTNNMSEGVTKLSPPSIPGMSISMDKPSDEKSDSSDTTSYELSPRRRTSVVNLRSETELEDTASSSPTNAPNRTSRVRTKRSGRPANLQIQNIPRPRISDGVKTPSPSKLTVEWPGDERENIATPRATSFDSSNSPGISKSPRRSRKISSGTPQQLKKTVADNSNEHVTGFSIGSRTRKSSGESRDVSRSRRESAGVEGDDEGYDELLSAYESEDGPDFSSR